MTNLEIQKYYQNEPGFNGVYSKINLPNKIKDGKIKDIRTHSIALYASNDNFILTVLELSILDMVLDFDMNGTFSVTTGGFGKYVTIFGVDMSLYMLITKKYIF